MLKVQEEKSVKMRVDEAIHAVLHSSTSKGSVFEEQTCTLRDAVYGEADYPFKSAGCPTSTSIRSGNFISDHTQKVTFKAKVNLERESVGTMTNTVNTVMRNGITKRIDFSKVTVHENSLLPETVDFLTQLFFWAKDVEALSCEITTYPGLNHFPADAMPFEPGYEGSTRLGPRERKTVVRDGFVQLPRHFGRGQGKRARVHASAGQGSSYEPQLVEVAAFTYASNPDAFAAAI